MNRRITENNWAPQWSSLTHKTRLRVESQPELQNMTIHPHIPGPDHSITEPLECKGLKKLPGKHSQPPIPHTRQGGGWDQCLPSPFLHHLYHMEPARARDVWELHLSAPHSCSSNSLLKCSSYFLLSVVSSPLLHTLLTMVLFSCAGYWELRIAMFLHLG